VAPQPISQSIANQNPNPPQTFTTLHQQQPPQSLKNGGGGVGIGKEQASKQEHIQSNSSIF
jgi:hypothetical protein